MAPAEIKDDFYAVLEVSHAANPEDIRKSYLRLAITRHPDKNPTEPGAKAAFQLLSAAYETISDPEKRRAYDTKWAGVGHSRPTQGEAERSQADAAERERKGAAEAARREWKDDEWTNLHRAAANGQEALMEQLLEAKADINAKGNGLTALHLAAINGHEAIVQLLLKAKADINAKGNGRTALHMAVISGHETILQLLLKAKADINAKGIGGWTALHLAAINGRKTIVQLLLEAKVDIDAMDDSGRTALYIAALNDHMNVLQQLWKAGASCHPPFRGLVRIGKGTWVGMVIGEVDPNRQ